MCSFLESLGASRPDRRLVQISIDISQGSKVAVGYAYLSRSSQL